MEKICGIYCIENKINHKKYIGQSIDIQTRIWAHRTVYRLNDRNNYLYEAMKKYGKDNFDYYILEECSKEDLDEKEKYWIKYYDTFKNGYNMTTGGQNGTEDKNAIKTRNKLPNRFCLADVDDVIKIAKLDLDYSIIEIYDSLNECARQNNIEATNISKCCRQLHKTCKGNIYLNYYQIQNLSKSEIKNYVNSLRNQYNFSEEFSTANRKISLLDENGNIKEIFKSINYAAKILGLDPSSITKVCKGRLKSTKGYKFAYV